MNANIDQGERGLFLKIWPNTPILCKVILDISFSITPTTCRILKHGPFCHQEGIYLHMVSKNMMVI